MVNAKVHVQLEGLQMYVQRAIQTKFEETEKETIRIVGEEFDKIDFEELVRKVAGEQLRHASESLIKDCISRMFWDERFKEVRDQITKVLADGLASKTVPAKFEGGF